MAARSFSRSALRRLRNWFFAGLVLILPFALTVYVLKLGFTWVDSILGGFAARTLGRRIPGLGIVVTVFLVVGVGAIASNFLGRRLLAWGEALMMRIPIIRSVYSTMKQVVDAFAGQNKSAFKEVTMIEYPRKGAYSIGFVTGEGFPEASIRTGLDLVTIFVPTVPNPTTGFFVLVPRSEVHRLNLSVEEGLKMLFSGGAIAPGSAPQEISGGEVPDHAS